MDLTSPSRKLKRWKEAGILTDDHVNQIIKYENEYKGNYIPRIIGALGGFAIWLGFISIIASNWNYISSTIKLTGNYIWLLGTAFGIVYSHKKQKDGLKGVFTIIFSGSILGSIALIGQIFHLSSHIFIPLVTWLVLISPVIYQSSSRIICSLYSILIISTSLSGISYLSKNGIMTQSDLLFGIVPLVLFLFCSYTKKKAYSEIFEIAFLSSLLVYTCIGGSISWVTSQKNVMYEYTISILVIAAACSYLYSRSRGQLIGILVFLSYLYCEISNLFMHNNLKIVGGIGFILLWAFAGYIGIKKKIKKLFDCACIVVGFRFVIVYFEIFGSLMKTGIGLVVTGLLILFIVFLGGKYKNILWAKGSNE